MGYDNFIISMFMVFIKDVSTIVIKMSIINNFKIYLSFGYHLIRIKHIPLIDFLVGIYIYYIYFDISSKKIAFISLLLMV